MRNSELDKYVLNGPVAGSSWTDRPKNARWENPPDDTDPEVALQKVLDGLSKPEVLDDLSVLMEIGFPLMSLRDTLNTMNVMEGRYSLDISAIISDTVLQQLKTIGDELNIDYVVGDEVSEEQKQEEEESKILAILKKRIRMSKKTKTADAGTELLENIQSDLERDPTAELNAEGFMENSTNFDDFTINERPEYSSDADQIEDLGGEPFNLLGDPSDQDNTNMGDRPQQIIPNLDPDEAPFEGDPPDEGPLSGPKNPRGIMTEDKGLMSRMNRRTV
jgi:hypothetical protein